jgi:hypothetical protein
LGSFQEIVDIADSIAIAVLELEAAIEDGELNL